MFELHYINKKKIIYKEFLYNNKEKKKNQMFQQHNSSGKHLICDLKNIQNKELLKQAVHIQVKEIQPEIRNLRNLKYEIMELNQEIENNKRKYSLYQYPVELSKLDSDFGEPMRVIKFNN